MRGNASEVSRWHLVAEVESQEAPSFVQGKKIAFWTAFQGVPEGCHRVVG